MRHELRYAFRQVRKNPGFALATILTLAIGIGATTSMFSLVNAVLLRPLPFPHPDQLTWVAYDDSRMGGNGVETFSYPNFFDVRNRNQSFDGLASYRNAGVTLTGMGDARQIDSEIVSADFFRVLGVAPAVGRDFTAGDEKKGARVAMLSWELWQHTFQGKPDIANSAIMLDNQQYLVAGVMPPGFSFPIKTPSPDLWTTMADDTNLREQRGAGVLNLIGRLKPGAPLEQARAEAAVIARSLAAEYPKQNLQFTRMTVERELDHLVGDTRPALRVLFGAVTCVLLIGCANVAGLMLARMSRRRSEVALLAAIGAGRGQILRQILAESVMLSTCGGAVGLLLAAWGTDAMLRLVPSSLPRLDRISMDAPVLLFAIAISILTGVAAGVFPAWRMSRVEPLAALRQGGRSATAGRRQNRAQTVLVIAETAISLVLVIAAGLLTRSFIGVLNVQPGFDAEHVLTAKLSIPENRYPRDRQMRLYGDLAADIETIPGVESVSAGWPLPLSGSDFNIGFKIEGRPAADGADPSEYMAVATPEFFHSMRIPVRAGREFIDADTTGSEPVMVVNEAFEHKYFPGESALGKRIQPGISDGTVKSTMREIVGVVGSVKRQGLKESFVPQYYLPWTQAVITWPTLVIRTAVDPASVAGALRTKVAGMDREIPVYGVVTLNERVYEAAAEPRFQTLLFLCFAGMALLLATVGLYAVLSYTVSQRAGEIGVRMALGASRNGILSLILGRGVALSLAGIAIGLAASAGLTQHLAGMLYGIEPFDVLTFASVSALLLAIAIGASVIPALRAARVDPMRVLREQ